MIYCDKALYSGFKQGINSLFEKEIEYIDILEHLDFFEEERLVGCVLCSGKTIFNLMEVIPSKRNINILLVLDYRLKVRDEIELCELQVDYLNIRKPSQKSPLWLSAMLKFHIQKKKQQVDRINQLNRYIFDSSRLIVSEMQLQEAYKKLHKMSQTDMLTGLYNRRAFFSFAEDEFSIIKCSGGVFTCAILDLDHFKQVNDTYGHLKGDEVLVTLAKLLMDKKILPESVVGGRYGGEEFLLLFRDMPLKTALTYLKKLKKKILQLHFKSDEQKDFTISASFGVSEFSQDDEDFDGIIRRADEALYEAKENGRNQIIISGQEDKPVYE